MKKYFSLIISVLLLIMSMGCSENKAEEFHSDDMKFLPKAEALEALKPLTYGANSFYLRAYGDYVFIAHWDEPYVLRYDVAENKIDAYLYLDNDFIWTVSEDGEKGVAYFRNNLSGESTVENQVLLDFGNQKITLTNQDKYDTSLAALERAQKIENDNKINAFVYKHLDKKIESLAPYYEYGGLVSFTAIDENRIAATIPDLERPWEMAFYTVLVIDVNEDKILQSLSLRD